MSFFDTLSALLVKDTLDSISQAKREVERDKNRYEQEIRNERMRMLGFLEKSLNQHDKIHNALMDYCMSIDDAPNSILSHYEYFLKACIAYPYYVVLQDIGSVDDNHKEWVRVLKANSSTYSGEEIVEAAFCKKNENPCAIAMALFMDATMGEVSAFWGYLFSHSFGSAKRIRACKKLITAEIALMRYFYKMQYKADLYGGSDDYITEIEETLNEKLEDMSSDENEFDVYDESYMNKFFAKVEEWEGKYISSCSFKVVIKNNLDYKFSNERSYAEWNIVKFSGVSIEYAKTLYENSGSVVKDGLTKEQAEQLVAKLKEVKVETEIARSWTALDDTFDIEKNIKTYEAEVKAKQIVLTKKIVKGGFWVAVIAGLFGVIGGFSHSDVLMAMGMVISFAGIVTCAASLIIDSVMVRGKEEKIAVSKIAKVLVLSIGSIALMIGLSLLGYGVRVGGLSCMMAALIWLGIGGIIHLTTKKKV